MNRRIFVPILLIFATLAVFWPASGFDFVNWDDNVNIYENRYLNPVTVENTLHFWVEPYEHMYLPATYTLWAALAWLSQYMPTAGGLNPHIFHTANLIIHLFNTFVVFSILRILLTHGFREAADDDEYTDPSKVEIAAGIGALIFALHPVQVESVALITGMKDLLCGLFSFLAIREYLVFAFASSGKSTANKKIHYILACAAFLLALLSKPAAVIVPLVLLILDRWAVKRPLKESAKALAGWFVAAFVFAVIAKSLQQSGPVVVAVPLWARPFIAGDALAFYLYKLVWPFELALDYGRSPKYVLEQWWIYVTWLFPFGLLAGMRFIKKGEVFLVSFGLFAASLLPVLGFIPFQYQKLSTVADHYQYLPMLGVALAASWIFLNRKTKFVGLLFLPVIVFFGTVSSFQLPVWKNNIALYTNNLKVNPASFTSHKNLGVALTETGNLNEAVFHFEKVIKHSPTDSDAHNNLGVVLDKLGRPDEAVVLYKKALQIKPDDANAHNNLAIVFEAQGKLDEAVFHYKKSLEIRPGIANTHFNLGNALVKLNKPEEAISHFSHALRIRPQFNPAKKQLAIANAKLKNR